MRSTRGAERATMEHRATEPEPITEPVDAKRAATLARMDKARAAKAIKRGAGEPGKNRLGSPTAEISVGPVFRAVALGGRVSAEALADADQIDRLARNQRVARLSASSNSR